MRFFLVRTVETNKLLGINMLYAFDFNYAGLVIDAAQDEDGQVWISTPTIENVLEIRSDSTRKLLASKSFNAFMGEGYQLGNFSKKSKSTKFNNTNLYYSKSLFLSLLYFVADYELFLLGQGSKTSEAKLNTHRKVKHLIQAGFVADFEGSVQNALGKQLSEEQREYLRQLVFNRLQAFRAWTDIIRERYLEFYGEKPEGWYYGKLIKEANIYLFGVENFGSDRTANMSKEQQMLICEFESMLARQAKKHPHFDPHALLTHTLNVCF
jgi:hypothetical protein